MNESFFEIRSNNFIRMFDKRGIFIILHSFTNKDSETELSKLFLWIGSRINPSLKQYYLKTALKHMKYLQKYEKAPKNIIEVHDGNETEEFLSIWFGDCDDKLEDRLNNLNNNFSEIVNDWNNWYRDVMIKNL